MLLVNLPTREALTLTVKCHRKFLAGSEFISAANAFHADKPDGPQCVVQNVLLVLVLIHCSEECTLCCRYYSFTCMDIY